MRPVRQWKGAILVCEESARSSCLRRRRRRRRRRWSLLSPLWHRQKPQSPKREQSRHREELGSDELRDLCAVNIRYKRLVLVSKRVKSTLWRFRCRGGGGGGGLGMPPTSCPPPPSQRSHFGFTVSPRKEIIQFYGQRRTHFIPSGGVKRFFKILNRSISLNSSALKLPEKNPKKNQLN